MKKLLFKLRFSGLLLIMLLSQVFVMPNPIPVYSVQFEVQNQLQQPITDATITFGSITHPPGDYNFLLTDPGTYPYTVVREGYQTAVGTVIIIEYSFEPIIVNVTLIAECAFIIHDATGPAGEDILIDVEIINIGFQIVAFQADIILPEGFSYLPGSAFLNPLRSDGHLFNANVLPGTNTLRMLAFSLTNVPFNGDSGIIASFTLTTPDIPGTCLLIPVVTLSGSCPYHIVVPGTVTLTPVVILSGDANCDGAVNVLDVTTTISYILGNNPQPFCFENADVNGDGSVNALDVIGTVNIIMGGGSFSCGTSTITDIDGNVYNTVQIGEQCWMKENLKTTRDAAGNTISRYCYDHNTENCNLYGGLYSWATMMNGAGSSNSNPSGVQGICLTGWHVPSASEWIQLINYLVAQGFQNTNIIYGAGNALKSCRQVNSPLGGECDTDEHPRWDSHGIHYGFDEFGFSALPGGQYSNSFDYLGTHGLFRSATEYSLSSVIHMGIGNYIGAVVYSITIFKTYGFSVRCIKD